MNIIKVYFLFENCPSPLWTKCFFFPSVQLAEVRQNVVTSIGIHIVEYHIMYKYYQNLVQCYSNGFFFLPLGMLAS